MAEAKNTLDDDLRQIHARMLASLDEVAAMREHGLSTPDINSIQGHIVEAVWDIEAIQKRQEDERR